MADREWFAVETADEQPMATNLSNIEAARTKCRELTSTAVGILTVARYTRTEVCTMEREITIIETPPPA